MAVKVGLVPYIVEFHPVQQRDRLLFGIGEEFDAWQLVQDHLIAKLNALENFDQQPNPNLRSGDHRSCRVVRVEHDATTGNIYGIMQSGSFGRSSEIVDRNTAETKFEKTWLDIDMPRFFFMFHFPNRAAAGAMIIQKAGIQSPKSSLEMLLKKYFVQSEIVMKTTRMADRAMLRAYLEMGSIQEIEMVTCKRQDDSRTILKDSKVAKKKVRKNTKFRLLVQSPDGFAGLQAKVKRFTSRRNRDYNPIEIIQVPGMEDPDQITVSVKTDSGTRKFNVFSPDSAGFDMDITDAIVFDETSGDPTFESLRRQADIYLNDEIKRML